MSIHVAIEHTTSYRFDRVTQLHPHVLRLRPAPHCRTPIEGYSLRVSPRDHFLNWQQDPFGNYLARLVFLEPATELEVVVDLVADLTVINPFDFFVEEDAEHMPFEYDAQLRRELDPYLRTASETGPLLDRWLSRIDTSGRPRTIDFLVDVNQRLYDDVEYSIRMEAGVQTPEETLRRGIGSCRDSGWLLVEALRRLGLAARFVSGYLVQLTSDQPALDGPDGPSADFTDLHAWAEVYLPGAGWVGLDPTSGLFAGEGHIPLACTPHPASAAPITGATSTADVEFEFSNTVRRIREDPRVTAPYTPEQWERIDRLGLAVDERLVAGDVRLTMGGEPTFVSVDDMDGAEWNTEADGPAKRALADSLAIRLRDRFGPGGIIQHSQGKWYPGEPLPRWQKGVVWRTDGDPLWRDADLLAGPGTVGSATERDVLLLAHAIAEGFGLDPANVMPAHEDPVDLAWRESLLPGGDPELKRIVDDADVSDPDERAKLVERLSVSVGEPTGWVLPIHAGDDGWATAEWPTRRGRLYLIPGDSPIGLRLPLGSLSWSAFPGEPERSTFEPRTLLAPPGTPPPDKSRVAGPADVPPTAMTFELRNGQLAVFLPPVERAEQVIEMLTVVEDAAATLSMPVVLEGYPLPRDPRFETLVVTPDPGVIEVNVHPAWSWNELRDTVEALYDEARQARLGTEKFALDGSHSGTGGGNHVTLGGPTPADSPLLRRPDLLRSLITFWQNHPSLSYLFSGQFIGPTSQAPRVDEGRTDNLYELEIAFEALERQGVETPPWAVDRALRNLLVDLTGNTHRSEFCIDKLFSPDSERGRLGLLELRAFEMPPHPQMALVQSVLVRSLVARFWEEPYRSPLVRWGTDLYDRFLLPWYVRADIDGVVADLAEHDLDFDRSWLDPFMEFRFPLVGEALVDGVELELRRAIEPWHVLGEEVSGAGTARYVDSSVERLQLRADNFNPERHLITCNGVPVPLQPTDRPGSSVAGVRFKAWSPWSSLHPSIGAHGPLVFDVIDRWSERSRGGCRYSVVHPGGRSYDTFPVNAAEAEARRSNRFFLHGHTPGRVDVAALDELAARLPREYARTLDLRKHDPSG